MGQGGEENDPHPDVFIPDVGMEMNRNVHGQTTLTTGQETDSNDHRTMRRNTELLVDNTRKRCDSCGKLCKNERGVKIHQGRSKDCKKQRQRRQASPSYNTQEVLSQDANHSALDQRATANPASLPKVERPRRESSDQERRARLHWPPASDARWKQLDNDLNYLLAASLNGTSTKKIERMTRMTFEICKDRFGTKQQTRPEAAISGPSRRQVEITNLRRELRQLRNQWKHSPESEKIALKVLRDETRKKLLSLKRAENLKKRNKAKQRTRKSFFDSPFRFVSNMLGKPKSGNLKCPIEEVQKSIADAHSDPMRDEPLGDCPIQTVLPEPSIPFDIGPFRFEEVHNIVKKARAGSAPGPPN